MDPRLHFFLVRESKDKTIRTLVPLIPADLLPEWIDFAGTPRAITIDQAEKMANVGTFPMGEGGDDEPAALKICSLSLSMVEKGAGAVASTHSASPGSSAKATTPEAASTVPAEISTLPGAITTEAAPVAGEKQQTALTTKTITIKPTALQPKQAPVQSREETKPPSKNPTRTTNTDRGPSQGALQPSNNNNHESSKNQAQGRDSPGREEASSPTETADHCDGGGGVYFCRHWCWHGTCKWGLQCRFKHSMPSTPQGLEQVGLRDFPAWWRSCVGSALAETNGVGLSPSRHHHHILRSTPTPLPLPLTISSYQHHHDTSSSSSSSQSSGLALRARHLREREIDREGWELDRQLLRRRQRELDEYERELREQRRRERDGERAMALGVGAISPMQAVKAALAVKNPGGAGEGVGGGGAEGGGRGPVGTVGGQVRGKTAVGGQEPHLLDV